MQNAVVVVPNLDETVLEYARLKEEHAALEKTMKRLRNVIEVALAEQPEHRATIAGFRLALVPVERRSFDLKAALEKLDKRKLRPFISTSEYTQLRLVPVGSVE